MDEETFKCGHVCLAAKRLGFSIKWTMGRFVWIDHITGKIIPGPQNDNKKKALSLACDVLTNELSCQNT